MAGKVNPVANYLLWVLVLKHLGMDFLAMNANQPLTTGTCLKLEDALEQEGDPTLRCIVSTGHPYPTVPRYNIQSGSPRSTGISEAG